MGMTHHEIPGRSLRRALGLLLPLLAITAATPAPAQTGWTQWTTGTGANNHWYLAVYVPGRINWADARSKAQALGGDLATITSAAENTFVYALINDPIFWDLLPNPTRVRGPWIGGFQPVGSPEPAASWTWVSGEPWVHSNWAPGEPNQAQGFEEDHLHFYADGTVRQPTWNDLRQNQLVPGFVVEATTPPIAAYLPLGTGCAPTGLQPATLLPAVPGVDLPRLGTTSRLRVDNLLPATQLVAVAVGLSNRYASSASGLVALPIDLGSVGWTGCQLRVAPDTIFGYAPSTAFVDHFVVLPANPALLGQAVFCQALALAAGGTSLTNSIAAYVGP